MGQRHSAVFGSSSDEGAVGGSIGGSGVRGTYQPFRPGKSSPSSIEEVWEESRPTSPVPGRISETSHRRRGILALPPIRIRNAKSSSSKSVKMMPASKTKSQYPLKGMITGLGIKGQSTSTARVAGCRFKSLAGFAYQAYKASATPDQVNRTNLLFAAESLDKQNQGVAAKDIQDFANTWKIDIERVEHSLDE